jgi:hypothetical protein
MMGFDPGFFSIFPFAMLMAHYADFFFWNSSDKSALFFKVLTNSAVEKKALRH